MQEGPLIAVLLLDLERGQVHSGIIRDLRRVLEDRALEPKAEVQLEERARPATTLSYAKAPPTAAQMHAAGTLIMALSYIARLLNLRGGDIPSNPLAHLRDLHGRLLPRKFKQLCEDALFAARGLFLEGR